MGAVTIETLSIAVQESWSADTSTARNWSEDNRAEGQCAVTACVVQDYFGGDILNTVATLPCGETVSHYLNVINGKPIDLTRQQFPPGTTFSEPAPKPRGYASTRAFCLSFEDTRNRYALLRKRVQEHMHPWEPPLAGNEVQQLLGALDRLRTTFRWKADDLDAAGLQARVGASSLTLGGLLKHLAAAEDHRFTTKLSGAPIGAPWDAMGWDGNGDWEFTFTSAATDSPEQLYALWDGAVERSRARLDAALANGGLDQLVYLAWPDGRRMSLRRLVCDMIEEYGRHTGHADLLREAVDGVVGEDPPPGWRPRSGSSVSSRSAGG